MTTASYAPLEPLLQEAEAKGLWLVTHQGVWFSPAELRAAHAKGTFKWGPPNWTLQHPQERLAELDAAVRAAQQIAERFQYRVLKERCQK